MGLLPAAFLVATLAAAPEKPPAGLRPLGFDEARHAAYLEQKPLLVVLCGADPDSKRLDDTTLKELKVRAWLHERFVAIRLEPAAAPELVQTFRVRTTPTVLILDGKGREIDRILGFRDGKALRAEGDAIVKSGDPLERLRARMRERADDFGLRMRLADLHFERGEIEASVLELEACYLSGEPWREPALKELVRLSQMTRSAAAAIERLVARLQPEIRALTAADAVVEEWLHVCAAAGLGGRVLAMYDALAEDGESAAPLRARLAPHLRDWFYTDRRYADLGPLLGDVKAALAARIARHAEVKAQPSADGKPEKRSLQALREDTARDYETLVGLKRIGEATLLADQLITYDPTVATYDVLVEHALRAESTAEARALALRGRADQRIEAKARARIAPHVAR